MDPFMPHEIFRPYAKDIPDTGPARADSVTVPAAPEPHMVSHPAQGGDEVSGQRRTGPDHAGQSALQTQYQDLPTEIKHHLLALHLAGKSPEQCLAVLRSYALVSKAAYEEVRHLLAEPEFLAAALQRTRHAAPELAILPLKTRSRHDEIAARMHELASTYPQLYADLSRHAKVPRRTLTLAKGWLPGFMTHQQPFSRIAAGDRPQAVKALLESKSLTFLQLRLDEDERAVGVRASDGAVNQVCQFLSATALGEPTNLQLHLECRFISHADAETLLHQLARCAGIGVMRGLNLQASLPGHDSAQRAQALQYLVDFVGQNKSLRQLNLSGNEITGAEASLLSNALKSNAGITELHLAHNQIDEAGAIALAALLSDGSPLRILALENNRINEIGADALNAALKTNSTLEQLYLGDNPTRFSAIWRDALSRVQAFRPTSAQSMPPMGIQ